MMILLVLLIVAFIGLLWIALVMSGSLSLRWTRTAPESRLNLGLWMALAPVLLGCFLFCFHLRWTVNGTVVDLSWPFAAPIAIGSVAILSWLYVRWKHRSGGRSR